MNQICRRCKLSQPPFTKARLLASVFCIGLANFQVWGNEMGAKSEDPFVRIVAEYADNVLQHGRDVYGATHTPLFIDGINIETHEPAIWVLSDEKVEKHHMPKRSVMSNLANHQVLFRTLDALTTLTGDPKYRQAAVDAFEYAFENLQHRTGLFYWGGHMCLDLETHRFIGEKHKEQPPGEVALTHELKTHLPFYEMMWQINPEATERFIKGFWANHVVDWETLEFNRHGYYDQSPENVWDHTYVGGDLPIVCKSMAFINTGSDLIYAAAMLYRRTGDKDALAWSKRLLSRYEDIRHPETGLAGYQFTVTPTWRIRQQFEAKFGNRINETTLINVGYTRRRYTHVAVVRLRLAEILGPDGYEYRDSAIKDLVALAKHGYDHEDNTFWAMNNDGLRLSPEDLQKKGYFSGEDLGKRPADGEYLWAYALAYKVTGDQFMWDMTRQIATGLELGLWYSPDRIEHAGTRYSWDPLVVFALVDLFKATGNESFLDLAEKVGHYLVKGFHKGFFTGGGPQYASFADMTPMALLYLVAARKGVELPPCVPGKTSFQCNYEGLGRTTDKSVFYSSPAYD